MLSCAALLLTVSMVTAQEGKVTTMPAELRTQIEEQMIGQWSFQATWGDKRMNGEVTMRWAGRKTGVVSQGYMNTDGKKINYVVLLAWDGVEGAMVSHGFTSDGETGTTHWTKFSKDKWTGHGSGIYQGVKWKSPTTLEFKKDSSRYEDVTDGKPWVAVYTRKPKTKK
jgi:hypothetical protein